MPHGYAPPAHGRPGEAGTVAEARRHPSLDRPPVLIGHSGFGDAGRSC
ncbi:hypothetical protein [Streptomyces sp. NPDC090798]